jgi:murein DD-endopeptidase MepM/ murein hydrolase activator NlpD
MRLYASLAGISAIMLLFFAPARGSADTSTQVSVQGNQAWTDTGIDLTLGSNVTITASGTIRIAGSDPGKTPAGGPECSASSDFVAPGLPCWSLIGRIGSGTPFYVGTATGFSVTTSGRLFLGVNDNSFPDNSGSWAATVTVTSQPADLFTNPMDRSKVTLEIDYNFKNPDLGGTSKCYAVPWSEAWHAGEDWFAPANTKVNAVANGVVRYSSKQIGVDDNGNPIYGGTTTYPGGVVIIEHTLPDGSLIYSMYAHLDPSKILVPKEADVTQGQIIADGLCNKGRCKGNVHLHWEMRFFFDGSGINNAPKYKKTCSGVPGPGYTYPGQPDNFVANGGAGPTYNWTDPSNFVDTH